MTAPYRKLLTIDYETRWSKGDYTISKMTTEEYVRDTRFKAFGACIHEYGSDDPIEWVSHEDLPRALAQYDWGETAVLCHNSQFDCAILSWVYGVKPCFIFDTLSMARALRGVEVGNSLMKLANEFGLPPKGNAVHSTDGLEELSREIEAELAEYCKHDVFLCEEIFKRLIVGYPSKELRLIDMTIKMYVDPVLELDSAMLVKALGEEKTKREGLLARLGVDEASLASNPKFAQILETLGVPAPMKTSKTTGKPALALAKSDAMFQALLNGDNEDVAALCEARLAVKSTTERTRAQRFLDISHRGTLPVPLSYYGAQTGRWTASKGSAINMQNLKRGSFLRKAIMAPEDYELVVGDLAQIEPRVLAWLSDYDELLDIFRSGRDAYAEFGAQMFGIPDLNKNTHPELRQSAKSALLGAGYQLGWASFAAQLLVGFLGAPPVRYDKKFAKQLGVDSEFITKFLNNKQNVTKMLEIPHICTDDELLIHCLAAKAIIDIYRKTAAPVVDFWKLCEGLIESALFGGREYTHKCLTFRKGEIELPNGMKLLYPNLRIEAELDAEGKKTGKNNWVYGEDGAKGVKLYAGKVTNNCLAKGTLVLTTRGWVAIESVTTKDGVHDGVDFRKHAGIINKGVQRCIVLDGILLTPDHKVLTYEGWQNASQVQRPYQPDIRHVDGASSRGECKRGLEVAVRMSLRQAGCKNGVGCSERYETRANPELRVQDTRFYRSEEYKTRYVKAPRIYCVAQYAREMLQHKSRSVQKLWRAWYHRLRALVGGVFQFLGGYVQWIPSALGIRQSRQRQGVFARKLSVGNEPREYNEQAQHRETCRRIRTESGDGDSQFNDILSVEPRMANSRVKEDPEFFQQVFDIVNCGPLNRFVVKSLTGAIVVHNCTQATARIVMTDGMLRVGKRYPIKGTVHDELIAVVPVEEAEEAKTWVLAEMVREPKYMPGIPLAADGGHHRRYGLAKN